MSTPPESAVAHAVVAPLVPPVASPRAKDSLQIVTGRTMRQALMTARATFGEKSVVVDQVTSPGRVTLAVSTRIPRSTEALREMRREAGVLLKAATATKPEASAGAQVPATVVSHPSVTGRPQRTPLADVERRLREHGASKKMREAVLEGIVKVDVEGAHPMDLAADEIAKHFDVATLPLPRGETAVVALLGHTGVGKTTTLAKLALRMARAGRKVALATLDADRVGGVAQIKAYGELLRIPSMALRDPVRLANQLALEPGRFDVVLVDGTGDVQKDVESLLALGDACDAASAKIQLATLVVLPATASAAAMESTTAIAAPLAPLGAVVTKLDEAQQPLPALEHARASGLGLAFLTNGPDLGPHFFRANKERFADLALIGRIG
ncbi:Flagellar biosynthesis protein FlhF [Planctomycetes bacterium Poly30]|uniref:Flagellar biosynthesis protein FlhF n=1 Tax=Saltatorellus ferox TaxID=2528018 RepID=A0A518ELR8_9BACT|nr:Flagellar biosynthesis protein FlhF [Planctomycetes bacterium Poly30]